MTESADVPSLNGSKVTSPYRLPSDNLNSDPEAEALNGTTNKIFVNQKIPDVNLEKGVKSNEDFKSASTKSTIGSDLESQKVKNKSCRRYLGICCTLLSGCLYSLTNLLFKLLKNDYDTFTISFWRYQGLLVPSILLILFRAFYMKKNDFQSIWPLTDKEKAKVFFFIIVRGIIGCWGLVLMFFTLLYLQVADATVITSSTSVFVSLLAHCFIGEKCSIIVILTAILTMGGVFIISRPPMLTGEVEFDIDIVIGIALAFACMLVTAAVIVVQRYLRTVNFELTTLSSGAWGTIQCAVMALFLEDFKLPQTGRDYLLAFGLAVFTVIAQCSIIVALKFEQAGPVSIVKSSDVIFAFIWQFLFLRIIPDYFSLVGATIIVFGVVMTGFRKYLTTLPIDHKLRWRFRILLL